MSDMWAILGMLTCALQIHIKGLLSRELTEEKIHLGWKNIYSLEITSEASSSSKVHSLKFLLFSFNRYTSE